MLKILLASAIAGAAMAGASAVSPAAAASHRVNKVAANGRCNGISYGTGQGRCGTRTGGPVGGNANRN